MKLLAINAGSSSLKFKLYEMPEENILVYGYIDKIGEKADVKIIMGDNITETTENLPNHNKAVDLLINIFLQNHIISKLEDIEAIGHRIVNGASHYKTEFINDNLLSYLTSLIPLSPVHMPGHLAGINAFKELLPATNQVAIYDTAFHHTIPKENYLYAIPYEWYQKYGIRKFGFHGISCAYITMEMTKILKKKPNLIICHIGNGASVTAVKDGKSLDNSMGFTANEGLIMGTRSGSIDYSILPYIMQKTSQSIEEIDEVLNKQSGLLGLAGVSDNRDLEKLINNKDYLAILANTMYINRIVEYIAKYYLKLYNIDALVLCGGVGENAIKFRKQLISKLNKLGIYLDEEKNKNISKFSKTNQGVITTPNSLIPCYIIPTDEELMLARETYKLLTQKA